MNIFELLFIAPIVNFLIAFYKLFSFISLPGALGWAIIGVTVLVRLAISPLMKKQIKESQKIQELQPAIVKLQKKYKNEPMKLQQAQAELYKNHKINPGFGCLIFIIQIPIFLGLYNALRIITVNGHFQETLTKINSMLWLPFLEIQSLDVWFFGFKLNELPSSWKNLGWWYLLVPIITALLQYYQSRLATMSMPKKRIEKKIIKTVDKEKQEEPDMATTMQKQMTILFPFMIGWLSFNFPIGLALYWNIFTLFGIVQYLEQRKLQSLKHTSKKTV